MPPLHLYVTTKSVSGLWEFFRWLERRRVAFKDTERGVFHLPALKIKIRGGRIEVTEVPGQVPAAGLERGSENA